MDDEGQRGGPGSAAIIALASAVLLFLIARVVIIVIVSFSGADYLSFPPPYLSLRWYQRFLGASSWRQAIWVSTETAPPPIPPFPPLFHRCAGTTRSSARRAGVRPSGSAPRSPS